MKIEFIKRGAATRLILIFAGWSTDARYYEDCVVDGWDTAVVSDYRDWTLSPIPAQYSTVYIFAYSLGVAAASISGIQATVRIAVCGSPLPVSDNYGIPESVYAGTIEGLSERTLMKFHLRMAGDKAAYDLLRKKLPENPDIEGLKDELKSIREASGRLENDVRFDRIYLAERDRIFPYCNMLAVWKGMPASHTVTLNASHAVDLRAVVNDCLPDTSAIGEGFAKAGDTYNENAVIQKDICLRIAHKLHKYLPSFRGRKVSLLEIGAGRGLLTDEWKKYIVPDKATYVDLTEMPVFGASPMEKYLNLDAEKWLEETDEQFDVILSASTVQWFSDPVRFINTVRSHLSSGGVGIISTFVAGNLEQLDHIRPCPIIYRSEEDYLSSGISEAECWEQTLRFDSVRDMVMHIRLTGVMPNRDTTGLKKNGSPVFKNSLTGLPRELTYRPMILVISN